MQKSRPDAACAGTHKALLSTEVHALVNIVEKIPDEKMCLAASPLS